MAGWCCEEGGGKRVPIFPGTPETNVKTVPIGGLGLRSGFLFRGELL